MVEQTVLIYVCDRCNKEVRIEKNLLNSFHIVSAFPKTWSKVNYKLLCDTCTQEFNKIFEDFMRFNK